MISGPPPTQGRDKFISYTLLLPQENHLHLEAVCFGSQLCYPGSIYVGLALNEEDAGKSWTILIMLLLSGALLVAFVKGEYQVTMAVPPVKEIFSVSCLSNILAEFLSDYNILVYEECGRIIDLISRTMVKHSVQIIRLENLSVPFANVRTRFVVIVSQNVSLLQNYLNLVSRKPQFRPEIMRFIVYVGKDGVADIFRVVGRYYMQRVLVLDLQGDFYTSTSFDVDCGMGHRKMALFHCSEADQVALDHIFTRNVTSLNQCEVRAMALMRPPFVIEQLGDNPTGIEPKMLELASKLYKVRIVYVQHNFTYWGSKKNGSYTYMTGALEQRQIDLVFGNVRMISTYLDDFEHGAIYVPSDLAFYVPQAQPLQNQYSIVNVFKATLWFSILTSLVLMMSSIYLTGIQAKVSEGYNVLSKAATQVYCIFLSQTTAMPKTSLIRSLLASWIVFSLVACKSYESTLLSHLITPTYTNQINSIEEIIDSGLHFGGGYYARTLFNDSDSNPYFRKLYHNFEICPNISCMNRTAHIRDFATMENTLTVTYYKRWYMEGPRPLIYKLPNVIQFNSWMLFNKGHPLAALTRKLVRSLRENGMLLKWQEDFLWDYKVDERTQHKPIRVAQLRLIFYVCCSGNVAALVTFAYEYLSENWEKVIGVILYGKSYLRRLARSTYLKIINFDTPHIEFRH